MTSAAPASGDRALIVNADDFGLSDGVCAGIVHAWRAGVVTSTSVLINVAGAPRRVAAAHEHDPDLPMGLHLNLTTGRPVLPPARVPSLVDAEGTFHAFPQILARLPTIALAHVRAECWAQAQLLLEMGVRFDHLDYHHHLLPSYPPFFTVVRELASAYRVPIRRPLPTPMPAARPSLDRAQVSPMLHAALEIARRPRQALRLLHQITPAAYWHELHQITADDIATPDRFIAGFSGTTTRHDVAQLLAKLPAGVSELMVHPGFVDDQLRRLGGTAVASRPAELWLLVNPSLRALLQTSGIRLVSFRSLTRQPPARR